jgi:hypothetical protein
MGYLFNYPSVAQRWERAYDNDFPDWDEVFDGFKSTTDLPGCVFYAQLSTVYPSAKVILTVRDPDALFESTVSILSSDFLDIWRRFPTWSVVDKGLRAAYGSSLDERAAFIARYEDHNARVCNSISRERLLVYQVRDGWDPLCEFLNVPVPNVPFPDINKKQNLPRPWQMYHDLAAKHVGGWGARGVPQPPPPIS